MRRAEGVVHIDIRNLRQLFGKRRVVGFLFVVITDVFQQHHVAVLHRGHGLLDFFADAIVHKRHGLAEQFGQFHGDGRERHGGFALALGPAEVRGQNQFAAFFNQQFQGRQRFDDARGVGDDHLAVFFFQRHVVIHAHKNAFAADIQISNSQFCHIKYLLCPADKGQRE